MATPDGVQLQRGLWLWGYWWGVFGSCWWEWGYRFTQVLRGVLWGCLEGLAKATMAGWRSSGECLGGLDIWRGLRLGQAFFLHEKKENQLPRCLVCWGGSWGVLTILGANLSSGGGVGLAHCKGGDRQFCAQLRADRQFWGRQFSRQFFGNSGSAIPRQFSFIK